MIIHNTNRRPPDREGGSHLDSNSPSLRGKLSLPEPVLSLKLPTSSITYVKTCIISEDSQLKHANIPVSDTKSL